jgi:hypothetical protein
LDTLKRRLGSVRIAALSGAVRGFLCVAVLMAACFGADLSAQSHLLSEDEIKAAYLFNFVKFVEWPSEAFSDSKAPIVIGVLGEGTFDSILKQTVAGKTIQARPLVIKHWTDVDGSWECHLLFVNASARGSLGEVLKRTKPLPVLTVGEMEDFAQRGGIINFITVDNKVRFEINNRTAKTAGLQISSKLLTLATKVWD